MPEPGLRLYSKFRLSYAAAPAAPDAGRHDGRSVHVLHLRKTGKERCRRFGTYAIENIFVAVTGKNAAATIRLN